MSRSASGFDGRVVVITGAGGGIGSALARRFARDGSRLALLDLAAPEDLARELAATTPTVALSCDVTRREDCESALDEARREFGGIDVLVNNAGITHRSAFGSTEESVLRAVMEVNYFGAVRMTQAALPSLRERRGQVIGVSSVAGFAPLLNGAGYVASKHALEGFMATLRVEEAPLGVSVLVVRPGFTDTPLVLKAIGGAGGRSRIPQRPVGKRMSPDRVADAVVRAAARRQRDLVLTPIGKASWWCSQLAPRLYDALMSASQRRRLPAAG
jgi:NAD(P)-dependent dehydrogenase (short-subunit alcohol dehydrogenase family)